jgi:starch synthase
MNGSPTVMIVAAEFWPLAKTGGLADMVRAIAISLRDRGLRVRVLLPGYRSVLSALSPLRDYRGSIGALGHRARLLVTRFEGLELIVLRCDELFDRPGNPYMEGENKPWTDNAERFGVLCHAAAAIVDGNSEIEPPDILHLHDWHAALTPAYIHSRSDALIVLTIHNFMFQGRFPRTIAYDLGLSDRPEILSAGELFGGFSFLQVGLALADVLVTVSSGYVAEIGSRNRFNWYYLRNESRERLTSITNWPQLDVWNPATDVHIPARYEKDSLERRPINRAALQELLGWEQSDGPILCTVSRITRPKGFRFLLGQTESLLGRGCRLIVLGDGDDRLKNAFSNLQQSHPGRIALRTPYDERETRLVLAGADALLMPSLTEPCGLSQQHAQVYGCVPIVSLCGGLQDTVCEGHTGFLFEPSNQHSFLAAIDRMLAAFCTSEWRKLQENCMSSHVWNTRDRDYSKLFCSLHNAMIKRADPTRRLAIQLGS